MKRNVLWIDCSAAALAGVAVILLCDWLSAIYALPRALLFFIGVMNLVYASYSFTLAKWTYRPQSMIGLLVVGNLLWAAVCLGLAFYFWPLATIWGLGHLIGEAIFVGGLATLEWRWRAHLCPAAVVHPVQRRFRA